jgi:hypothetical protein
MVDIFWEVRIVCGSDFCMASYGRRCALLLDGSDLFLPPHNLLARFPQHYSHPFMILPHFYIPVNFVERSSRNRHIIGQLLENGTGRAKIPG